MRHFIGEEIEVRFRKRPGPPTSFIWRGVEYKITEILGRRLALDRGRAWYRRKHRDYYTVATDTGEVFKIYRHRGPGRRYWFLRMKVEPDEGGR